MASASIDECLQWTTTATSAGRYGIIEACKASATCNARWSSFSSGKCSTARHFYCFQSNE